MIEVWNRTPAGFDFHQHRSRHRTVYDLMPDAKGKAKEALWVMLENVWGAGGVLLKVEWTDGTAVYFDRECHYPPYTSNAHGQ
jgi:hypothetical protein